MDWLGIAEKIESRREADSERSKESYKAKYNTYSDELLAVFSTSQFKDGQAKLMSSRPPAMAQSSDGPLTPDFFFWRCTYANPVPRLGRCPFQIS